MAKSKQTIIHAELWRYSVAPAYIIMSYSPDIKENDPAQIIFIFLSKMECKSSLLVILYSTTISVNIQKKKTNHWMRINWTILKQFHAHLLDGQLQQLWQAGCQHTNEKWRGWATDVQHAGWQHRHKGVLPGEGVQQRQHCMATQRQHTASNREGEKKTPFSLHTQFFSTTSWKWPTLSPF